MASPERKYIKYVLFKIDTIIFYNYCSVRFFTHNNVPPDLIDPGDTRIIAACAKETSAYVIQY